MLTSARDCCMPAVSTAEGRSKERRDQPSTVVYDCPKCMALLGHGCSDCTHVVVHHVGNLCHARTPAGGVLQTVARCDIGLCACYGYG